MNEPSFIELEKPEKSSMGLGWYVRARKTENGDPYYLTTNRIIEPDYTGRKSIMLFYFKSYDKAIECMREYYSNWNEPFPYDPLNEKLIYESQTMKFN